MKRKRPLDFALLARVLEIYQGALSESPEAREFLSSKGITGALAERFELGYAAGTLGHILPRDPAILRKLRDLGILVGRGRGGEYLKGSLVLPLFDASGRVVELAGISGQGGPVLRAGADGGVMNAAAMKSHADVKLLTDPFDALSEIARGQEDVVAVLEGEWSGITEGVFREAAPHSVRVEDKGIRKAFAGLGIGTDARQAATVIENGQVGGGFSVTLGKRRYIASAFSDKGPRQLRALLRAVGETPGRFACDALNLYSSRERANFVREAALVFGAETSLVQADMAEIISLVEKALESKGTDGAVQVSEEDRREAVEYLKDPKLLERILSDFEKIGLVGEETNKLVGYLVAVSRKMPDPISMLILARSAAGKSTIAEAVASLVPPEDVVRLTRLTGKSLFYQEDQSLRHKVLVVEEESGIAEAAYPLRVLQSAKRLAVSTPQGSREVEGPVAVIVTTTSSNLNDETRSRFIVTSVDESPEQTRKILRLQRKLEAGAAPPLERVIRRHHALQRLLRPLRVVNPFARDLTFPAHRLSMRREQPKYLALIRAVAFLRQYQRKTKDGAVLVDKSDIRLANDIASVVLRHTLEDLSPPARRLLSAIRKWRPKERFARSELRGHLGWGNGQIWKYVKELVDQEYLLDHGGRPRRFALSEDEEEGSGDLGLCIPSRKTPRIRHSTAFPRSSRNDESASK